MLWEQHLVAGQALPSLCVHVELQPFFSVAVQDLVWEQLLVAGQALPSLCVQVELQPFFSVAVQVLVHLVVVVVLVSVDLAGVCGVWANTIPPISNIADTKAIVFFIVVNFLKDTG